MPTARSRYRRRPVLDQLARGQVERATSSRTTVATPVDPVQTTILALSPTVYMRMNQTGIQNPVDSSTNARTMLLVALGYTWGVAGPTSDGATALGTDGTATIIEATTARIALAGDQSRLAWVKLTSSDASPGYEGNAACMVFGDSSGSVWDSFGVNGGKARYTRFNNSAWQTFDSAASVNDGAWHLIAMTYNSVTRAVEIYVDGADDGGGTMTAHQNQGGINAYLFGFAPGDTFPAGSVAHLAVFPAVLTPANIAAIWASRLAT